MVFGSTGSTAIPLTPASGTPLAPDPLMSLQTAPPLVVCQTCPTFTPPIAAHASLVLAGLKAIPPIQAFGSTTLAMLKAGRLPVMSVHAGEGSVALVTRKTLPSVLAVITTFAFAGPVTISCSRSVNGEIVLPNVRSGVMALQPDGPAGTPPVVERQTRLVPANSRCANEGSMTNGAMNAEGSPHAGSLDPSRHGPASTKESSGDAASPPTMVESPRAIPRFGVAM